MSIAAALLKEVSENSPLFTKLVLNDITINDDDIIKLVSIFPKDSYISQIFIGLHSLTPKSYPYLLELVQTHPNITAFYCGLIMPPSLNGTSYIEAIREVVEENKLAKRDSDMRSGMPSASAPAAPAAAPSADVIAAGLSRDKVIDPPAPLQDPPETVQPLRFSQPIPSFSASFPDITPKLSASHHLPVHL